MDPPDKSLGTANRDLAVIDDMIKLNPQLSVMSPRLRRWRSTERHRSAWVLHDFCVQTRNVYRSFSPQQRRRRETQSCAKTLRDSERTLILQMLQVADWRIGGPKGAAAMLGLNRTMLMFRMRKLGIERPFRHVASAGSFMTV
ncbi:MAG: formate hydrogenlyase transcriptional activator, partial [Acidobacteriaceae bacterium]|nr:formate hydrogenlyase transcriptional activator [Acidobacteriaceae bacterium]